MIRSRPACGITVAGCLLAAGGKVRADTPPLPPFGVWALFYGLDQASGLFGHHR
jgi:hypothetical protein